MRVRRPARLVLCSFGPLLAAALLYGYATRPARLKAGCAAALERFGLSIVELGAIRHTPWGGLELSELRLVRRSTGTPTPSSADRDCEIRVRNVRARCGWLGLLGGGFDLTSLDIDGAVVDLVQSRGGGPEPWRRLDAVDRPALPRRAPDLPRVRVRSADVRLLADGQPRRLLRRWILDARGEPSAAGAPGGSGGYTLRIDQVGGSALGPRSASAAPLLELTWQDDGVQAGLDWLDVDLLEAVAPRSVAPWLARLDASGYVRVARFAADARGLAELDLRLDEGSFCVPVEDADLRPSERFLHVTQAAGALRLWTDRPPDSIGPDAADAAFELQGFVNGAPALLRGEVRQIRALPERAALADAEAVLSGRRLALGDYRVECRVESLEFPSPERHGDFFSSSSLPGPVRAFLHDYEPRGRFSMSFSVRPTVAGDPASARAPQVEGVLELHGASCRYFRFPYPVSDITGRVRLADGVLHLDGLVGRHGSALIAGHGRVLGTDAWAGLDLVFDATNVPLDGQLLAALPADYQQLWHDARPVGLCDVRTTVRRPTGSARTGPLEADVTVDARLLAGSLSLPDGDSDRPRARVRAADGRIRIARGAVHVHDLGGQLGSATIRVDGAVAIGHGSSSPAIASQRKLHVEAGAISLSYSGDIVVAEPGSNAGRNARSLGRVSFQGTGDAWGQLGEAGREDHCVRVRDGVLTGFDPQQTWRETVGWIVARASGQQRVFLASRRDGGRLELSGYFLRDGARTAPVELSLSAEDADMDRLLRGLLPLPWAEAREVLGVSGAGRVRARFVGGQAQTSADHRSEQSAEPTRSIEVEVGAEKMRLAALPLELRDVHISGTIGAEGYEIAAARARCAEGGVIELRGAGGGWPSAGVSQPPHPPQTQTPDPAGPHPPPATTSGARVGRSDSSGAWADLTVSARGLSAGPPLFDALPARLGEMLRRMSLSGTLDVDLERVRVERGGKRWELAGLVRAAKADLELGLSARGLECELSGECEAGEDGELALIADLRIQRGTLLGRPVTDLTARVVRLPGERWVRLEPLHGGLCSGRFFGYAHIDPGTADYELSVTLQDVSLRELVGREPPADPAAAGGNGGKLDGRVFVRGRGRQVHGRVGGGELRIRGASWLALPVSASLLAAGRSARQPLEADPQVAALRFVWEGDTLRFTFVEIRTPELRFVGAGRWDLRSDALTMTLVASPPTGLGELGDLLSGAGANLMQYRVTGTAAAPRVSVEPLGGVSQALEQLLRAR